MKFDDIKKKADELTARKARGFGADENAAWSLNDFHARLHKMMQRSRANAVTAQEEYNRIAAQNKVTNTRNMNERGLYVRGESQGRFRKLLRYFVECSEPILGVFINGAQQKAINAYKLGWRAWHTRYIQDLADVSVDVNDNNVHIKIHPYDGFVFEFVSSSQPVVEENFTQLGLTFAGYRGLTVRVDVQMEKGAMTITPTISKQRRSAPGQSERDTSIIGRPSQIELISEPVAYHHGVDRFDRVRYPYQLFESFAPGNPHTGVHLRSMSIGSNAGQIAYRSPFTQHYLRDRGYDVPWMTNQNILGVEMAYIRTNADWPRANGLQVVVDPVYGTREFAIFIDAYNQFHVFPTSQIQTLNGYSQNVPSGMVQRVTPTIPAWCYKQTGKAIDLPSADLGNGHWQVDQPEPDWRFRHDGRKVASIFYERVLYERDDALFDSTDGTTAPDPFTQADFDTFVADFGVQARQQFTFAAGYNENRYFVAPGIIEIDIAITITGDLPENFSVNLTTREVRRPTTHGRCALYVGYVWHDVPFGASKNKQQADGSFKDMRVGKKGQFVTMDIERWVDGNYGQARLLSVRDLDTDVELACYSGSSVLAHDMQTLSFVIRLDDPDYAPRVMPYKPGAGQPFVNADWIVPHHMAQVIIGCKVAELLYPKTFPPEKIGTYTTQENLQPLQTREMWEVLRAEHDEANPSNPYVLLELTDTRDWTYSNYNDYRLWWLTSQVQNLAGPHTQPANHAEVTKFLYGDCYAYFPALHLYWGAVIKPVWYAYADEICNVHVSNPDTTFFVHPNGTWTFFDNSTLYVKGGTPYNTYGDVITYLPAFAEADHKLIEHVIFDRVHFEIRTKKGVLAKRDTSFQELHNIAVRTGKEAKSLEGNINEIADADLRATFSVDEFNPADGHNTRWAEIKATWNGVSYWFPETSIQKGDYYVSGSPTAAQCGIIGASFNHGWNTAAAYGGFVTFPCWDSFHVRFCDPLVLQSVTATAGG